MSLDQTRIWKCDICEKTETVSSGSPMGWKTNVEVYCADRKVSADICGECYARAFPTKSYSVQAGDVPTGEFKRPWWRKFWKQDSELKDEK